MLKLKPAKPKYRDMFDTLSREIISGRFKPGQKFPSEAALVRRFRVSRITAGRAVSELQRKGFVDRIAGSGTYVSTPNSASESGPIFGLLIPNLGETEIFEPICQAIANSPDAEGKALLWGHANVSAADKQQQAWHLCEQYVARRVSGVFFAPLELARSANTANRRIMTALQEAKIPVVLLDRRPEGIAASKRSDLAGIDNERAGYIATEHLLKLGAKRIGFFAYEHQASTVAARIAGYRRALSVYRADKDTRVLIGLSEPGTLELPAWARKCDAFVCANDRMAARLMHTLMAKNIRIPQDMRIVGIDDISYASLLPVPLTTVRQPCREIGEAALRLMLERIQRPGMPARTVLLDCELIVRESCGAALAV